ncbi:LamG-like jellyroll fold domain-containing protein [Croceimicrobium sp.]|uniref:LamG domain-containing protein n=1 Tax=Croceimicrobium sp. TaxID=2828340 RepID=UPI003BA899A8
MRIKYPLLSLVLFCSSLSLNAQNALNFDGADDRLSCGNDASVQLSGSAISLEAWIFPTAWTTQVWQGNIINKENNSPDYGYMLRCGDNGKLNFNLGNGSWNELTTAANTLSLNTWQHVAGTYDGSMIRLYVNGIQVDSASMSMSFSSGLQNLTVGNWSNTPDRAFMGSIDEVRVWNIVRTKGEIAANMNAEFCTAPAGLVAYYQLNEGTAGGSNANLNIAPDLSGNGNTGNLANFALNGSVSNWIIGSPINPASDFVQIVDSTCTDYLGAGGIVYDSTGVYLDTLQNSDGCDSIIELNLTVNSVNNAVTANSNILVSQQTNGTYQWLDCSNGNAWVNGATNQLLSPPDPTHSYAVIVNYKGCVDTSDCTFLAGIGLSEQSRTNFEVYPNPAQGPIQVSHPGIHEGRLELISLGGKILLSQALKGEASTIDTEELEAGLYLLRLQSGQSQQLEKIRILK